MTKRLVPGERLDGIDAASWNRFDDTATRLEGILGAAAPPERPGVAAGGLPVKLVLDEAREAYQIVGLGEPLVSAEVEGHIPYAGPPIVHAEAPAAKHASKFAVLLAGGIADQVVEAVTMGVCWCRVNVVSTSHTTAGLVAGDSAKLESGKSGAQILSPLTSTGVQWCQVLLGGGGAGGPTTITVAGGLLCVIANGDLAGENPLGPGLATHSGDAYARSFEVAPYSEYKAVPLVYGSADLLSGDDRLYMKPPDDGRLFDAGTITADGVGNVTLSGATWPDWLEDAIDAEETVYLAADDDGTGRRWLVLTYESDTAITVQDESLATDLTVTGSDYRIWQPNQELTCLVIGKWGGLHRNDLVLLYEAAYDEPQDEEEEPVYFAMPFEAWAALRAIAPFDPTKIQAHIHDGGVPSFSGRDCDGDEVAAS